MAGLSHEDTLMVDVPNFRPPVPDMATVPSRQSDRASSRVRADVQAASEPA